MILPKSFAEAETIYNSSVSLSQKWISKYYPKRDCNFFGVPLERVQAFSQHYFFSYLTVEGSVNDILDQYSSGKTEKIRLGRLLRSIASQLFNYLVSRGQIGENLNFKTDIVILSSRRHLNDQMPLVQALAKKHKILVIGKIEDNSKSALSENKIPFISLTSGAFLFSRRERLKNLLLFALPSWEKKSSHPLLDNIYWSKRLWYLRLQLFPEIAALLTFANNLFKKTEPKILLTTSSNDTLGASFSLMAKKYGITVVELQHGYTNVGTDSRFYNSDYQLVWGEMPGRIRRKYGDKSVIVGCPFLEKPKGANQKVLNMKPKIHLLILWSPPFGTLISFQSKSNKEALREIISGLSKLPENFKITFRSHPSYDLSADVEGTTFPSNIYFSNRGTAVEAVNLANVVITQPTTAGFIAALYKKPLIFFNNSWITQKYGDPFIDSNSALNVPLSDLEKIDQYVLNLLNNRNLLKKQQLAQEKFIKEYCSCFGEESWDKISKSIERVIKDKNKTSD